MSMMTILTIMTTDRFAYTAKPEDANNPPTVVAEFDPLRARFGLVESGLESARQIRLFICLSG
jgi:hypothetical protein